MSNLLKILMSPKVLVTSSVCLFITIAYAIISASSQPISPIADANNSMSSSSPNNSSTNIIKEPSTSSSLESPKLRAVKSRQCIKYPDSTAKGYFEKCYDNEVYASDFSKEEYLNLLREKIKREHEFSQRDPVGYQFRVEQNAQLKEEYERRVERGANPPFNNY